MLELLYQARLMISPSPASCFLCVSCNTKYFRGSGTLQQWIWFSGHAMQREILSPQLIISMHCEWELTILMFYPIRKHNYLWTDWVLFVIQFPSKDVKTSCSQAFQRLNVAQHRISCYSFVVLQIPAHFIILHGHFTQAPLTPLAFLLSKIYILIFFAESQLNCWMKQEINSKHTLVNNKG